MPPQQPTKPRRSLEVISMWAFFATLVVSIFALIPFVAIPSSTVKTFLLAAGALLTLALYILAHLSRGNIILPPFLLVGALWLPVIAYALSAAFSSVPFTHTFWGISLEPDTLGFMLIAGVLGTLAALVLRRSEHYDLFLRVGAFVFSIIALLEVCIVILGQFAPDTISPTFSIVGSFDDLAFLLGLGVVSILVTFRFLELSQRVQRALVVSGVAALFLLALANSSVVWVLLALVSLGFFVEAVMQRGPKATDSDLDDDSIKSDRVIETDEGSHSLILPLSVLAVSLFFFIGGTLGGALANALHVNVLNIRPSWQSTFSIARESYATTAVFGTGPGTFGAEWLKYRDASLNSTVFWNIDFSSGIGFIPTSFITTGIVGACAWIVFLGLFIALGLRVLIARAPEDAFIRYVAILSFVGSLYLFVIAIFGLPNAVILALAFVFAGLFISTTRFAVRGRQWGIIFSRSPRLGFVIVFLLTILLLASVVAAYTLLGRSIAVVELARAVTDLNAGNLDKAEQVIQRSISFAPSTAAYQVEASIATARLAQIVASSTISATVAQQTFQEALSAGINAALTATRLSPSDYQSWLMLGNLYAQAVPLNVPSAYESAKAAYAKARVLNPTNPQILYILAQLDIAHKDIQAAKENLKAAIALKQNYTNAIFLLSQLEVQSGNVKDALASTRAAAYFEPNNPNILFQVGILSAAENDLVSAAEALSSAIAVNPQFANARYFLSAVYAKQGDYTNALVQIEAIAAMSDENAKAVVSQRATLQTGKNPFPANLLSVSPTRVE